MRRGFWPGASTLLPVLALILSGCGTLHRHGRDHDEDEERALANAWKITPEVESRIMALNPEHVTEKDIRDTLTHAPAPRVICIHGGIPMVISVMISFCDFLEGMGYPRQSLTNTGDGTYTFSCYESSEMIAGVIGWYYEHEGLRPMIVGHSQGGMQVVKVLYDLNAHPSAKVHVWNPITWKKERRYEITDPLTGQRRPVVGLQLPYATSLCAGGVTRFMPNQMDMVFRLRSIPDSVEEFTGFYKRGDILGGDFLGHGSINHFHAAKNANVRNIELPATWSHYTIPDTKHLLKSRAVIDRVNDYTPEKPLALDDPANSNPEMRHMMWAEDVWFSIKKHWVLELQRLIGARRAGTLVGAPAKTGTAPASASNSGHGD